MHPGLPEQGHPEVTQWGVLFGKNDAMTHLQPASASGHNGGNVLDHVSMAKVRAPAQDCVIEQARAVRFLGPLENVDELAQHLRAFLVP